MPMDYDGNDISHHNLQLAGESRARSSSISRPYDFPKFDFDDSLQGHLRFDSLVETEVFLGIQSQEDNQWIEDFSRVSNGMEFNSTPVDSCSISRRNNVWSEATSSESVEMLLKSVGQEEMLPGVSINADQDTNLSKVVDSSNINLRDRNDVHGTTSDTTLPHVEEQLENPSAALSKDEPLCGTLTDSEILEESRKSVEKTINEGDSSGFPSITDHVDSTIEMPSTSKAFQQVNSSVSHESCIDDGQDKHVSSKTELENAAIHTFSDSKRESREANLDSVRESVDNLVKGEFDLKSSERDDFESSTTLIQTKRPENTLAELGSITSEHCTSPKQLIDPTTQLPHKQDSDNVKEISSSPSKCKSVSEMPLLSMEVNEASIMLNEGSKECLKDTIASGEESVPHLLADDMNIPVQVSQDKLGHRRPDFSETEKDICKTKVASKEMTCDLENMDTKSIGIPKNDNKTQLLEVREGLNVDADGHKLMPLSSGKLELEKKGSTSTSIKASTTAVELHSDNQEEDGIVGASPLPEVDNTSKVGVSVVADTMRVPSSETSAMSQQPVEKADNICSSAPSTKKVLHSMSLDCKESSSKENVDLASGGETMAKEEDKESGQTGDIDKTSCGSSTIISSSEPSKLENEDRPEGKDDQNTNKVKDIQSTSEVLKRLDTSGDDCGFTFKVDALPDTIDQDPKRNWSPFPNVEKSMVLEETTPSGKGKTEKSTSHKSPRHGETGPGASKGTSERKGRRGSAKGTTKENIKKGNQPKSPNKQNSSLKVEKVSTSNLPDLNASAMRSSSTASSSSTCRQPFSDLQQVQLRAQIFVYGSLIQGHVPDEAFMVSAFGQYEGGRGFWERTWRAATERVENQKCNSIAAGTPRSQSGARPSDAVKQSSHANRVPATPTSRANNKETPSAILSPIIPLSSPFWNISTPSRDNLTPNPHKGPNFQQALTPLHPYQTPPIRNYVNHTSLSSQTGFPSPWLASPQTSSFNASVQCRPVTMSETVKLTPVKDTSVSLTSIGKHTPSSPALHAVSPSPSLEGVPPIHDPKSITSTVQHSVDSKPRKRKKVPSIPSLNPSVSEAILNKPAPDASIASPIVPEKSNLDPIKGGACSEETLTKVAEANSQAEDAEALSKAAVMHCEDLWSQLTKQKVSGLTLETEAKLASSAAAVAAASSVAKAAALAARIASNVALQAKLMADNVLSSSGKSSKEGAKRKVEASLAPSRQAENLDAIIKASELAASAVAQAGKIVSMGEPLPLSELIEAGPEGYWKLPQGPQPSVVLTEKVRNRKIDQSGDISLMKAGIPSVDFVEKGGPIVVGDVIEDEKDLRTGIDHEVSDTSKSCTEAPEIDTRLGPTKIKNDCHDVAAPVVDDIMEGSRVEVFNPRSAQKSAWYNANVMTVEEGKAYVCYTDLLLEKGSGNVQEWVPIGSDGNKAPIIRTVHPSSALPHQQTRKRRRAALGDYVWCVGDRVDVWIDDCWWEGVVTEKNAKDETTLKVHLSAQGQTQTVRAWNLRASRSWINGKWIEFSPSKGQHTSVLSDTPKQKRQKLDSFVVYKLKDKESNNLNSTLEKPEQSKLLTLSTSERTFNIGKTTTTNDNKCAPCRPLRTNQQKEGSRVVFGVPKPTRKKRKFMEVSKHFSTNKTEKNNEPNDSVKFAKYLMPQGAPSQRWKVPTRNNDSKDKRIVESRPRLLTSRRAQRNLPQRDNTRSKSTQNSDVVEDFVSHNENTSEKSVDHSSDAFEGSVEAPLSSLVSNSLSTTSKRIPSLNSKNDRINRGRLGEKLNKIEDKVSSSDTDVSEPRRSNRRIQPTHRLLEGLQSSMVIPKMPAVSYEKSRRNLPAKGK